MPASPYNSKLYSMSCVDCNLTWWWSTRLRSPRPVVFVVLLASNRPHVLQGALCEVCVTGHVLVSFERPQEDMVNIRYSKPKSLDLSLSTLTFSLDLYLVSGLQPSSGLESFWGNGTFFKARTENSNLIFGTFSWGLHLLSELQHSLGTLGFKNSTFL